MERAHIDGGDPDRGSAVLVVATVVPLLAVLAGGLVHIGVRIVRHEHAQAAADAAALAGVIGGPSLARRVAAENDAQVTEYVVAGDAIVVTVTARGEQATARAGRAP